MFSQQRKRFFNHTNKSDGGASSGSSSTPSRLDIPRHNSLQSHPSFSSEGTSNGFGLPERSLSGSAALLRQRSGYSPSSSSPPSLKKKIRKATVTASGDSDGTLPQYAAAGSMSSSSTTSHFTDFDGSSNYHLNVNHYSSSHGQTYRRSRNSWDRWLKPLFYMAAFAGLSMFALQSHQASRRLQHSIQERDTEILQHRESLHQLEHRIQRLRSETSNLQSQVEELEDAPNLTHLEMQRKLFHLEHHKMLVEQAIQTNSRRQLQER